ncbi:Tat (twin-arginine translocation) pathway signal sequence [Prosthecobacter debontii]|uniref:Tat (Twin-arginine translocation) pathway signal sequence n=1 Tax=Prosthecobacter debontii TaxID=48467 RepID=A0A1T4X4S6_9BACT|nr:TIM barrel protein [Prosthecobacter debontii]SKA84045.1 Tat (twin-arginine translocation) pathway signal sequence [Prosthecobacter debontii]
MPDRRSFLKNAALVGSSIAFAGSPAFAATSRQRTNKLCFFTKHLQGLGYEDIASLAVEMGVDGVESPIRPKGHIEPEAVEVELPKYVEALKKQGLELTVMTSGINEVSAEQHTEKVLRTAAALGVKRYRMNYFKYDLTKPIWPQLQDLRPKIKDLVQLSSEIGIQPLFQNHSGKDYVAAPIWDMYSIMREYDPKQFGFLFDIFHATLEGGYSWQTNAKLTEDHWGGVYFKDFQWKGRKGENCPLGQGQVSPDFAKMLVKNNFAGPISLHLEYLKGDATSPAVLKEFREAHQRDLKVLKEWMNWA